MIPTYDALKVAEAALMSAGSLKTHNINQYTYEEIDEARESITNTLRVMDEFTSKLTGGNKQ